MTSAPLQAYADREKSCARGDERQGIPTDFTRPRPERASRWGLFLDLLVQALKIWGFPALHRFITTSSRLISTASSVSDSSFVIVAAFLHLTSSHYEFCDVQSQHFSNKSERTRFHRLRLALRHVPTDLRVHRSFPSN